MTTPRTISKESRFFVVGNTREEDVACHYQRCIE